MANFAPAYPQNLQELFSSPNFSLWQPAMDQYNTAQQQAKQNIGLSEQLYRQNEEQFPVELDGKRALAENYRGQAAHSNALSAQIKDTLAALPPAEQRMALAMAKQRQAMTEAQRKQGDDEIGMLSQWAAVAKSNGGAIPLDKLTEVPKQYRQLLTGPKGIAAAEAIVRAHTSLSPAYQQAMDVEALQGLNRLENTRLAGQYQVQAAGVRAEASNKGGTPQDKIALLMAKGDYKTLFSMASLAEKNQQPEEALRLKTLAQEAFAREYEKAQAPAAEAGKKKIDVPKMLEGKLGGPVAPAAPVPQKPTTAKTPPAVMSFDEFVQWRKANGG